MVKRTSVQNIFMLVAACLLLAMLVLSCDGSSSKDGREPVIPEPIFPPAVFLADKNTDDVNELFAAFDDGTDIIRLSGRLTAGGDVIAFAVSPDGLLVAYLADQETDNRFELYVVPADGGTAIEVSDLRLSASDVQDDFQWSPGRRTAACSPIVPIRSILITSSCSPCGPTAAVIPECPSPP
jgi:hypothetical protein